MATDKYPSDIIQPVVISCIYVKWEQPLRFMVKKYDYSRKFLGEIKENEENGKKTRRLATGKALAYGLSPVANEILK